MALTELRRSPLVEQAIERLREQVTSGAWPVGSRLPSEATLAAELGVGRSTIREAIRALASTAVPRTPSASSTGVTSTGPVVRPMLPPKPNQLMAVWRPPLAIRAERAASGWKAATPRPDRAIASQVRR